MSWPIPLWMLVALLYLLFWLATKRFRLSADVVLALLIYAMTIADQIWWLFVAQVAAERIVVYVAELERQKRKLAARGGLEVAAELLHKNQNAALNRVVNDQASISEYHPRFPTLRNGLRWQTVLMFLFQAGVYFVIQEVRQPGYLRTFFGK